MFVIIMFLANLILVDPSWAQRLYVLALSDIVKVSIVQNASILADKAYSPNYIGLKIGQQVLFINNDVNEHTVTFGSWATIFWRGVCNGTIEGSGYWR